MNAYESIVNPAPIVPQIPIQKPNDANKLVTEMESVSLSTAPSLNSVATNSLSTPAGSSDYGYGSDIRHPSSSTGYRSTHSSHSTPHNFDSGVSYPLNSGSQYQYQQNNGNICADGSWSQSNAMIWDQQNQCWVENTCKELSNNRSPIRESLDSRIELLLKQQSAGLAPSFLDLMSAMGSPPFVANDFNNSPKNKSHESSSRTHHNHRRELDSDAILGTPPSPFLSASEFIKWHKLTKQIDSGRDPDLDVSDSESAKNNLDEDGGQDDSTPLKDEPQESKRSRKSSKKGLEDEDDIDDDRMSLSSLSSGEKLHIGESEPSTSALHPHPMYPSEQVQLMARLGLWKPGMGSDIGLSGLPVFSSTSSQPNFTSPSTPAFAPFMFPVNGQSFTSQSGQPYPQPCFYPSGVSGYLSSNVSTFSSMSSMSAQITSTSKVPQMPHSNPEWFKQNSEANKIQITRNSLNIIVSELKDLIKKDICKKMVESSAFKNYEKWWDECERKSKTSTVDQRFSTKADVFSRSRQSSADWHSMPSMPSLYDNTRSESVDTFNSYGGGLGLRAALPKMPSFRRQLKPPSPVDDNTIDTKITESDVEADKLSDESDDDGFRRTSRPQKNRAAAVIEESHSRSSSSGSSSSSSDSSSSESSSSSDSESDSDSSSSSSSSESSSSSSSSSSESSVSSKSSDGKRKKKYRKHRPRTAKNVVEDKSDSESEKSEQRKIDLKSEISEKSTKDISCEESDQPKDSEITSQLEYEASQALMALASSSFSSVPSSARFEDSERKDDSVKGRKLGKKVPIGSDTESASEAELYANDMPQTSVAFDHSYCLPESVLRRERVSDLDSLIDSVARGDAEAKDKSSQLSDHMYSRSNMGSTLGKNQKRQYKRKTSTTPSKSPNQEFHQSLYGAVASEWRKAKRKPSNVTAQVPDILPERSPSPQPVFKKRDLIEEMNILYEFLKTGIDSEDVSYMKRSYEAMLQEDNQIWWLNDIHWVEHPPTHVGSPKKKKKTEDGQTRVHQTGCARSEGYYKMDFWEKKRLSHVSNTSVNSCPNNNDDDLPKQIRARQVGTQQSTREARSNQRRLLATVDAAWSDLLKFNQLQVSPATIMTQVNHKSITSQSQVNHKSTSISNRSPF